VAQIDLSFDLYPKQMLALTTSAQLTLYGGAAGVEPRSTRDVMPVAWNGFESNVSW